LALRDEEPTGLVVVVVEEVEEEEEDCFEGRESSNPEGRTKPLGRCWRSGAEEEVGLVLEEEDGMVSFIVSAGGSSWSMRGGLMSSASSFGGGRVELGGRESFWLDVKVRKISCQRLVHFVTVGVSQDGRKEARPHLNDLVEPTKAPPPSFAARGLPPSRARPLPLVVFVSHPTIFGLAPCLVPSGRRTATTRREEEREVAVLDFDLP
jgi:hypothetical protein